MSENQILEQEIVNHLDAKGIELRNRNVDDNGEIYYSTDHVALFLAPNEKRVSIAFLATMRPDDSARFALLLSQISWVEQVEIMEPFLFNRKKELLHGDEAFEEIKIELTHQALKEISKRHYYDHMLESMDEKSLPHC
jgi:hypothetical protein